MATVTNQSSEVPSNNVEKLTLGTSNQNITVRLLRMWEVRNFKKDGALISLDMLLLDDKDSLIRGSIHHRRIKQFKNNLEEGQVHHISDFEVVRSYDRYKVTDNANTIRFTESTSVVVDRTDAFSIKNEFFRILDYSSCLALANTNLQLPDVVGQIMSVEGANMEDSSSTEKVLINLLLTQGTRVRLTVWDQQATAFRKQFLLQGRESMVVVCTCLNPKLFAGTLYLNSTGATKFFFGDHLETVKHFKTSLGIFKPNIYPTIENSETKAKEMERMTLKSVIEYMNSSTDQEKEIICRATITEIATRNGWNFVSCGRCSKQLLRGESSFTCQVCKNPNATAKLKFRVDCQVSDDEEQVTFVLFDQDTRKLTNHKAEDIANMQASEDAAVESSESIIPQCITELVGRTLDFQIKISKFNFETSSKSFTVTRVVREIGKESKERSCLAAQQSDAACIQAGNNLTKQPLCRAKEKGKGPMKQPTESEDKTASMEQEQDKHTPTVTMDCKETLSAKRKNEESGQEEFTTASRKKERTD